MPGEATSALVLVTTREATKRGNLRIGAGAKFAFPKKRARSAVLVVPVSGGQLTFVTSKKSTVHVRVDVLGYSVNQYPIKIRALSPTGVVRAKMKAGQVAPVQVAGVGGVPPKAKWVAGVVLQVRTKGKGKEAGTLKAYPSDGGPPGTRSAPILSHKSYTTLLVTKVGADGRILLSPSVRSRVRAIIVGFIHR